MSVETATINNALVYRDATVTTRWYDAFGPSVVKYLTEFVSMAADASTGDPIDWQLNITEVGAGVSTAVLTDAAGGALLITTAGDENDGWQMQLAGTAGENVLLDGSYYTYFGTKLQIDDATQSDLLVGLCVTDTDCLGAVTDGVYFRKIDGSTDLNCVMEKGSVEDPSSVLTVVADTDYILEFLFDGRQLRAYVDGTLAFPNTEELRLTVEFLTGEDAAKTCTMSWLRLIHLRG
jgi:hypothetical protein